VSHITEFSIFFFNKVTPLFIESDIKELLFKDFFFWLVHSLLVILHTIQLNILVICKNKSKFKKQPHKPEIKREN